MLKKYRTILKELPYFFLGVITSSLILTFNFLYGRQMIRVQLFLAVIFACNLYISLNVIRGVYGRLIGGAKSVELHNSIVSVPDIKESGLKDKRFASKVAGFLLLLSCVSMVLSTMAPFLYKQNSINTVSYLVMLLSAYALSTCSTTFFTYTRIWDRKLKRLNNKSLQLEEGELKASSKLSRYEIAELIGNFMLDSITRFAEIGLVFLYGSGRIHFGLFIGLSAVLRTLDILLLSYSAYDRFTQLKLVEEDNVVLRDTCDACVNKEKKIKPVEEIVISNRKLMMLWCIGCVMLSSIGKTVASVLYQTDKISTPLYFVLTCLSITAGVSIMFAFNINRVLDAKVTQQNFDMVVGIKKEYLANINTAVSDLDVLDSCNEVAGTDVKTSQMSFLEFVRSCRKNNRCK